ncbi:hypothetical protein KDI_28800 [Dictyobacter arantiisoli]|uniref:Uncharacterized protein n=1 Tax=Dictyobacter arantiisoli TaxID=2014874 RepID=A0A5A5TDQ2_9CHLR|nr:hypothetical protein KDI_28800 [Dictyobacter arantiisoli]
MARAWVQRLRERKYLRWSNKRYEHKEETGTSTKINRLPIGAKAYYEESQGQIIS